MTRPTGPADRPDRPDRRVLLDLDGVALHRPRPGVVTTSPPYETAGNDRLLLALVRAGVADVTTPTISVSLHDDRAGALDDEELLTLTTDEAVDLAYALLALVREADAEVTP